MTVDYNYDTSKAGPFAIGASKNLINLRPRLDLDYTMIAGLNCTECPSHNYNNIQSESLGSLKPIKQNQTLKFLDSQRQGTNEVVGSFVSDAVSPDYATTTAKIFAADTARHEFFLIQNMTIRKDEESFVKAVMGDGYMGLAPDLGSGMKTYPQYLK